MTLEEIAVWVLRGIGALYFLAGLYAMRQAFFWGNLEPQMDQLLDALDSLSAESEGKPAPAKRQTDVRRQYWLFAGAVMLALAGGAMVFAHRAAAVLLALLIVQQMAYFLRQRRMELRAPNADQAEEARPARATINGFFSSLAVALLAAWLFHRGALI